MDNKPLTFYNKKVEFTNSIPNPVSGKSYNIEYDNHLPLMEELKYFIGVINGKKLEVASGSSAVDVMQILDKATKELIDDKNGKR